MLNERLKNKYENHIKIIQDLDSNIEDIKVISCKFFREGGNSACKGCEQDEHTVRTCADNYAANIMERPMPHWTPEFNKLQVRDKVSVKDIPQLGLNCNTCYMAERCPMFKVDAMCAIKFEIDENIVQPKQGLDFLISLQMRRIQRAMAIEEYDGGVPDQNLSNEMDRLVGYYRERADLDTTKISINASASMPGQKQGSGMMEKIFGNLIKKPEQQQITEGPITTDIEHEIIEPIPVQVKTETVKTKKQPPQK